MQVPPQFISPRADRKSHAGWTLIELMMAVLCGTILMASLTVVAVFATRSYLAVANYRDLDDNSRNALDILSRDIRSMELVTSYATNAISLVAPDGSAVTYTWTPSTTAFTRTYTAAGGSTTSSMLLTNCTALAFGIYSQVPIGSFNFPSASTNPAQTKLINVSWRCARAIFGTETNSESVQTAKIVIRN
jgi:type IV pilus assembly protein PilW